MSTSMSTDVSTDVSTSQPSADRKARGWFGFRGKRGQPGLPTGRGHPPLDINGLHQCFRVAFGGTLGFFISQLMGWNYGVFFTVFPMFLLGMVPILNQSIIRQFLTNASMNIIEVSLISGLLKHMPIIMTLVVLGIFLFRFNLMSKGPLFLYAANGIVNLSVMLHFASYPTVDLSDLLTCAVVASFLAVFIAMLMHTLFPDVTPRQPPPRVEKSPARIRHETIIGGVTATLSFMVFQIYDLRGSLSAQMATVLVLFAMGYAGAQVSSIKRIVGTLLGCTMALVMQMMLYNQSNHFLLVTVIYWIGLMLFAREHVREAGGSGVGFGGMTTLGILFGQSLGPNQDLVYSALYRFSSMAYALTLTLMVMGCLHYLLNWWEATRV